MNQHRTVWACTNQYPVHSLTSTALRRGLHLLLETPPSPTRLLPAIRASLRYPQHAPVLVVARAEALRALYEALQHEDGLVFLLRPDDLPPPATLESARAILVSYEVLAYHLLLSEATDLLPLPLPGALLLDDADLACDLLRPLLGYRLDLEALASIGGALIQSDHPDVAQHLERCLSRFAGALAKAPESLGFFARADLAEPALALAQTLTSAGSLLQPHLPALSLLSRAAARCLLQFADPEDLSLGFRLESATRPILIGHRLDLAALLRCALLDHVTAVVALGTSLSVFGDFSLFGELLGLHSPRGRIVRPGIRLQDQLTIALRDDELDDLAPGPTILRLEHLPFPSSTDPFTAALKAADTGWFTRYALPTAIAAVRRIVFTRLATPEDTLTLVITDPRLTSTPFGWMFLQALHPAALYRAPTCQRHSQPDSLSLSSVLSS